MSDLTDAAATDLFRRPPNDYLDVGHAEVAHRTVGQGPDVLFVHGFPVSGATFRRLLPHLAQHLTCHLIDLPGAGSSRFDRNSDISFGGHVAAVKAVIDQLDVAEIAVVGHNSGGMIARHAIDGDARLRALGLINTEPFHPLGWRFRSFVASSRLPGFRRVLGWAAGQPRVRRLELVLGGAFVDTSHLDGEFDEFFLNPLNTKPERLDAAMRLLDSFDDRYVRELADIHARIDVPVQLVWGTEDPFFPVAHARQLVSHFAQCDLAEIPNSGLFSHEETPQAVAEALLPVLQDQR